MRIKKKTSIMLLAASVAAVVGVGAVSFAQWNGSNATQLTASGATGSAYLFGFENANALNFENPLVPYDQRDNTIENGQTAVSVALPAYTVYSEAYTITVATAAVAADKATSADTTYYVYISGSTTLSEEEAFGGAANENWHAVTTTGAVFNYDAPANAEAHTVKNQYIHVAMVSANKDDMNKEFKFEITLATVAPVSSQS